MDVKISIRLGLIPNWTTLPGDCRSINRLDVQAPETELRKNSQDAPGIFFAVANEKIKIRRVAGIAVMSDGECANDEILNFVRV